MGSQSRTKQTASIRWNKFTNRGENTLPANSVDGEPDHQLTLMESMKAMIGFVEDPLVSISIDRKRGGAKLLCATSGAQKLIFSPNARVDAFLGHCVRMENGSHDATRWNAPNGDTYR